MHVTFGMYGIKKDMDEVIKWLETRAFPFERTKEDGTKETIILQGALRPLVLFDFVFPESSKDLVLTSLKADTEAHGQYKRIGYFKKLVRKALGLKPIPKFKKDLTMPLPLKSLENVAIYPLGVRYDDFRKFPDGYHEAL